MYDLFAFIFQNSFLLRGTVLFILGLVIGSFLNVIIYRLPLIMKRRMYNECVSILNADLPLNNDKLNLLVPHSHCPNCKCKVPFWSNIPIVGYLILNGKCFNCKVKIPISYPLIELITAVLFVIAGYISNDTIVLPAYLLFISFTLCIIVIDYKTFLIPDELSLILVWLGLLVNLHGAIAGSLSNAVLGAVLGYLFLWLVYWGFKIITKRDGMGYGDFKFLSAILAFAGYQALIPVLLISSSVGILYFIVMRLANRLSVASGSLIPFGPFLGIAGLVLVLANKYIDLAMFSL